MSCEWLLGPQDALRGGRNSPLSCLSQKAAKANDEHSGSLVIAIFKL